MTDNHRCFCELVPLYVLDLLDFEDRLWIEAQIIDCPDLAEELADYQAAVGAIPYTAPPMPMSPDLKDRLFDRSSIRSRLHSSLSYRIDRTFVGNGNN
jgi:hypothetical protein